MKAWLSLPACTPAVAMPTALPAAPRRSFRQPGPASTYQTPESCLPPPFCFALSLNLLPKPLTLTSGMLLPWPSFRTGRLWPGLCPNLGVATPESSSRSLAGSPRPYPSGTWGSPPPSPPFPSFALGDLGLAHPQDLGADQAPRPRWPSPAWQHQEGAAAAPGSAGA